jgi:hypothetical protein
MLLPAIYIPPRLLRFLSNALVAALFPFQPTRHAQP